MEKRMNTRHGSTALVGAIAAAALVLSACETTPKTNPTLEAARVAVQQAESDPNVAKYSASELDKARKMLINADAAAKAKGAAAKDASHYAYLATQLAHIAEQRAHEQAALARIKQGETERQQILLSARENEANVAVAQARAAQSDAEQARNAAQSAMAETQNALAEKQLLATQLADLKAQQTNRGIVLTLSDVLFDTGRSELKPGAQRSIDEIAAFLAQHPERRVQIEGFTDSQGANDYNLELSQRRADAVANAIIRRGVDAQRVRALGYGEEYPVASNDNSGSRQLNRRVEIIVANDDGAIPGRAQ
jgi:outer membrane protein OmpA-like peptidoglycan-associated protein